LSELQQIFNNFDNLWHNEGQDDEII